MSYDNEQDFTGQKVDPKVWKRLITYGLRNKRLVMGTVLAMILVAVIDACYPLLTNYAIDHFIIPGTSQGVGSFLALYIGLCLIQACGTLGFILASGHVEMNISYDIRQDGFLKLQEQSFAFYDKTAVGYLMARMISDVGRLSEMIAWSVVDIMWSTVYSAVCIVVMFVKNWKLALIVVAVIPPLAIATHFLEKAIHKYQRQARRHNSRITGAFNEGIMGAMTTKTLVREDENSKEFQTLTTDMRKASIKAALISASFFPLIISLGAIGTSLALCIGGDGVLHPETAWIGGISAGTLIAFVSYAANLFDPIQQLAAIFEETAANEKEHAKMWFKALNGGSIPDTMTCLEMAAGGEHDEWTEMYPRMAAEAKEEGFTQLAALFTMVAQIEKEHEERYRELAENLKNNKVFAREEQQVWQCRNCGYTYIGKSAPLKCPVCAHPQSYFELKKHNY